MRLALSFLAVMMMTGGCGPETPGDDSDGGSTTSVTGESTTTTTADTGAPTTTETTDETTGPAACPAAAVPEVMFTVSEIMEDFQGHVVGDCTVTGFELAVLDTVILTCDFGAGPIEVSVSYANAVVPLPAALQQLGAPVQFSYVRAAYEYRGEWVAIHAAEQLVLGLAAGDSALPRDEDMVPLDEFYAPVSVLAQGGLCPKGPGFCQMLGEPAVLQFSTPEDTLAAFPLQAGALGPFTVHSGASWLSDPASGNQCDGAVDDLAAFVIGRP